MKYQLTDYNTRLQNIFRILFGCLVAFIVTILVLKFSLNSKNNSEYFELADIITDITLFIIAPICLLYFHRTFRAYITRQSEGYKMLFQKNPHAMWVYDINTLRFLMVNDAAVSLYGYSQEEFLRMRVSDIRPPEDIPAFLQEEEAVNTDFSLPYHKSGIWKHNNKDGSIIYAEVSSYEVVFNGRQAALALSYNVTDKIMQELRLVTVNQELEQKVKDRTNDLLLLNQTLIGQNKTIKNTNQDLAKLSEELRRANEKLKDHSQMKSQFVSLVSHEFRTPLANIRFAAEYVNQHHQEITAEQILEKTSRIMKTVGQMELLLNDVLAIERTESPKITAVIEPVDLKMFIDGIVKEVLQATNQSHKIVVESNALPAKFNSDEKLLRNIFLNLLGNAIKYSPDNKTVIFSAALSSSNVCFEVKDHGEGIKPEYLDKIFEPFYRTPCVKNIPGTGLGLSIVKRAVDVMGGKISVKSEQGKGSTFIVQLPLN